MTESQSAAKLWFYIKQGLFQRIFGVGWIGISTAGQAGMEIEVSGIPAPEKAKALIDERM